MPEQELPGGQERVQRLGLQRRRRQVPLVHPQVRAGDRGARPRPLLRGHRRQRGVRTQQVAGQDVTTCNMST